VECETGTGDPNIESALYSLPFVESHSAEAGTNVIMLDAAADSDDFEPEKIWLKKRVVSEPVKRTARRRS
jgi:hypothetical protein